MPLTVPQFPFVVEDGTMVKGSNTYVSVAEADTYLSANIHVGPTWMALDVTTKMELLVWATRYIDQRATWNGITTSSWLSNPDTTNEVGTWAIPPGQTLIPGQYVLPTQLIGSGQPIPTQSLRWPRACVRDVDDNVVAFNVIPTQLRQAVMEMARYLIVSDRSTERPQDGLTELRVDVITLRFKPDYYLPIVPSEISYIIRGLGFIGSGAMNFAKITRA